MRVVGYSRPMNGARHQVAGPKRERVLQSRRPVLDDENPLNLSLPTPTG